MAQQATGVAAGRVNRRFLLLAFILAALSAVLVYAYLTGSSGGDESPSATTVPVVVSKVAIAAGAEISAEDLEVQQVPQSAVGDLAIRDIETAVGQVTRYPLAVNEQVLLSKLVGSSVVSNDVLANILEEGKRGMAIRAEEVVGAGGLVLPGDYVDVFAIPDQLVGEDHQRAFLVAENVEVIAVAITPVEVPATAPGIVEEERQEVATTGERSSQRVRGADGEPDTETVTYTLMLTPEQAANVFCSDELGVLRLAVRAFGDDSPTGIPIDTCVIDASEDNN